MPVRIVSMKVVLSNLCWCLCILSILGLKTSLQMNHLSELNVSSLLYLQTLDCEILIDPIYSSVNSSYRPGKFV